MTGKARQLSPDELRKCSFALLVGINNYKKVSRLRKLRWAENDAKRMRDSLIEHGCFAPENITLLLGDKATRKRINDAFSTIARKVEKLPRALKEDVRLLFQFSGHGKSIQIDGSRDTVLVTADYDGVTRDWGIKAGDLRSGFSNVGAKQTLAFIDCCHAQGAVGAKGETPNLSTSCLAVGKATLFACKEDQFAWESGSGPNSYFAQAVAEALDKDGPDGEIITFQHVAEYAMERVPELCKDEDSFPIQEPFMHLGKGAGQIVMGVRSAKQLSTKVNTKQRVPRNRRDVLLLGLLAIATGCLAVAMYYAVPRKDKLSGAAATSCTVGERPAAMTSSAPTGSEKPASSTSTTTLSTEHTPAPSKPAPDAAPDNDEPDADATCTMSGSATCKQVGWCTIKVDEPGLSQSTQQVTVSFQLGKAWKSSQCTLQGGARTGTITCQRSDPLSHYILEQASWSIAKCTD